MKKMTIKISTGNDKALFSITSTMHHPKSKELLVRSRADIDNLVESGRISLPEVLQLYYFGLEMLRDNYAIDYHLYDSMSENPDIEEAKHTLWLMFRFYFSAYGDHRESV